MAKAVSEAIAHTAGHMGLGILTNLFELLATLYVALGAFLLLVLLPIALLARVPLRRFLSAIAEPVSIATSVEIDMSHRLRAGMPASIRFALVTRGAPLLSR